MRVILIAVMLANVAAAALAERPAADGFTCYGFAAEVTTSRGYFSTADGEGQPMVMIWPMTSGALLLVNPVTGESESVRVPKGGSSPFASILSRDNKFYTLTGGAFNAFDPATRAFTFSEPTGDRAAMWMTEDDRGRIWSGTYPKAHLIMFDPVAGRLTDFGAMNEESWPQYPRFVSTDDTGWVYASIGFTACQIVAFNPDTHEFRKLLSSDERKQRRPSFDSCRGKNSRVYIQPTPGSPWYELHAGDRRIVEGPPATDERVHETASHQSARFGDLPGGGRVLDLDLPARRMTVTLPGQGEKTIELNYDCPGAHIMSLIAAPDGRSIIGSTGLPLRIWRLNPETQRITHEGRQDLGGHFNALARIGETLYSGHYAGGGLYAYDPSAEISEENPRLLMRSTPVIHRPHALLALADGRRLILAGTPDYGLTGGGLVVYDTGKSDYRILTADELLPDLSTKALENLPGGLVLGGSSTRPGTGGQAKREEAELYVFDPDACRIVWHEPVLAEVDTYVDFKLGTDGLVYGVALRGETPVFFVFDPATRRLLREESVDSFGRLAGAQAPRVITVGPDGTVYVLFENAIAQLKPGAQRLEKLADLPTRGNAGLVWLNNSLYFTDANRVWSFSLGDRE